VREGLGQAMDRQWSRRAPGCAVAHIGVRRLARLMFAVACVGCTLDSSPERAPKGTSSDGSDGLGQDASFQPNASLPTGIGQVGGDAGPPRDSGASDPADETAQVADEQDAGADPAMRDSGPPSVDAGTTTDTPAAEPDAGNGTSTTAPSPMCSRAALRQQADAYLLAMASGDPKSLRLHAMVRYTENGATARLGGGVWGRHAETKFARHVVDETRCVSVTQAVLTNVTGHVFFAVRLRYRDEQLLEAEAQVVPEILANTDVDAFIPVGSDPWTEVVPEAQRMSRGAMEELVERYFDSASSGGDVPPSAPQCRRLQNGKPLGDGTCTSRPGSMRFEQRRVDAIDHANGILATTMLYNNHIGLYLFKLADESMQSIEIVGGASSESTGW
jgi:hypothetical protein